MSNGQSESERRTKDRVDLNRAVQLKFGKFQDFLTEIACNISPSGMFVHSDSPQEVGEEFEFECSLADGFPLVRGRAEVVWVRRASSAGKPSGMGVRFLELMDKSVALIRRIVEERLKAGEGTFDLEVEGSKVRPGAEGVVPEQGFSDEIVAATERLVEDSTSLTLTEEPAMELSVEHILASTSIAGPELPPASENEEAEPLESSEPAQVLGQPEAKSEPRPSTELSDTEEVPEAERMEPAKSVEPPKPAVSPKEGAEHSAPTGKPAQPPPVRLPDALREPAPALSVAARVSDAAQPAGRPRPKRRLGLGRLIELLVFSLLAGLGMVLLLHQFWWRPQIDGLEARLEELTGSSRIGGPPGIRRAQPAEASLQETEDVVATPSPSANPASVPPDGALDEQARESPQDVVKKWAEAWSKGRVDDYLSAYSAAFVPASGATRADWETRRRERLVNSGFIRVAVVSLSAEEVSPTEMLVTFTQSYQSDTFRDRVRKILRLVSENGEWKIVEELVVRQLPW